MPRHRPSPSTRPESTGAPPPGPPREAEAGRGAAGRRARGARRSGTGSPRDAGGSGDRDSPARGATGGSGPIGGGRSSDLVLALAAAALLFGALALFGARYHWVEEAGSAERDGFVAQAEAILAGELPDDPFRPALYPLAVAGVARLGLPPFDAARLLANLSAAALAWLAWWIGRRLAGPPAGWAAFALTAVNPNLWILGQHVTTDVPFAALSAAALGAGLAYLERPGWRPALLAGLFLGLAGFTRATAWFLVPALAVAWWFGGRGGRGPAPALRDAGRAGSSEQALRDAGRAGSPGLVGGREGRRWGHLAGAGVVAALVMVPHFALRWAAFGDPFHDENWKNLAFKLYGFPDWSYLHRVPFAGAREVVAADPLRVLTGFLEELWRFLAGGGLSQLLGTPVHALLALLGTLLALATLGRPHREGRAGVREQSPLGPGASAPAAPSPGEPARASTPEATPPPSLRSPTPTSPDEPALPASRRAGAGRRPPSPLAVRTLWVLLAAASFLAAVALTFFTWGRLLLVLLPLGNALAAVPWGSDPDLRRSRDALRARGRQWIVALRSRRPGIASSRLAAAASRLRKAGAAWLPGGPAASLLLLLVALLAAKTFLFRLPAFVDRHPYAEVAALRALAAEVPPGTVLAGTSPFLGRYVDRPYLYVPDAFGPEVTDPDLYYARLHALLADAGAAYLVTGPLDLRDRPASLLAEAPPVEWLAPAKATERSPEGTRAWRVVAFL